MTDEFHPSRSREIHAWTSSRSMWCSLIGVASVLISGCGGQGEQRQPAKINPVENNQQANRPEQDILGEQLAEREPNDHGDVAGNDAIDGDDAPKDDFSRLTEPVEAPPAKTKNPIIRGIEGLLGTDRLIDEDQKDGLQEMLEEADESLTRVKRENRDALKNMNRQVRLNNQRPPNIVLIIADDLGCGDLGCYGQSQIQTPYLDRLAREGGRLTDFYANSPDGATSRWCLMSGKHTGHLPKDAPLPPSMQADDFTLGEMLWQASYDTAWIGKWGLRGDDVEDFPLSHGFEEWWGTADTLDQTDLYPAQIWSNDAKIGISANADGKQQLPATEIFTQEAIRFLEKEGPRKPFFLVISYPLPSANVETPKISDAPYTGEEWPDAKKQHAARITQLDLEIGRVLETLDRQNLTHRTIVCVTSDNSPAQGTPAREYFSSTSELRMEPGKMYEGSLRIPCVIRWPGKVKPDQSIAYPGTLCDLYPTIADMAGAMRRNRNIDGRSLVKALQGTSMDRPDILYWQMNSPEFTQSVRKGDWKVVRPARIKGLQDLELYNLKSDPGETTNVAADHPDVLKSMIVKPKADEGV
ncbi:MAG: sulfatase-like hydrolase/transferase [Planctomycetaceae bacterium]